LDSSVALTLIHELGHVYNIVDSLGGSKVLNDASESAPYNNAAEVKNAEILSVCHPK
jgi:hypothetical protein